MEDFGLLKMKGRIFEEKLVKHTWTIINSFWLNDISHNNINAININIDNMKNNYLEINNIFKDAIHRFTGEKFE